MTQVRHVQLLGARSNSLPAVLRFHSRAELDPMQFESINEQQACHDDNLQRDNSAMDGVRAEPPAGEDDDAQIIFFAPTRRKKRRRRIEYPNSTFPFGQNCRPQIDLPSPKFYNVLPQPARRMSSGVVQRLELCHIGEEKSLPIRAGSFPSCGESNCSTIQCPWFAEPSYSSAPASQFPSLTDAAAWEDQSLPTLQPRPLPSIPWKPIHLDAQHPNKRKHDESIDDTAAGPTPLRKCVQVSPRTSPT
ncbi:hypothetical protein ONS95_001865 [Cadophora gregata]|uniref:uncharacterized protein n=1 Tax=Cadophora gregata TaxID=51156 RepID=UPI0026DD802F|nr:uncharacterized protein ONS95_001865 [Cadophora gregata]KAK0111511.1 hypothetical protein ONS95_001865 [Cadophora gregata]